LDHKENEEILEEFEVEPTARKIIRCKSICLRHVTRTNSSRMARIVLNCRAVGRGGLGRPLKRETDETETGL
jgi:hypothetical protein